MNSAVGIADCGPTMLCVRSFGRVYLGTVDSAWCLCAVVAWVRHSASCLCTAWHEGNAHFPRWQGTADAGSRARQFACAILLG